jgi:catechol 2,3-dioxygenase-like lactoylglutathione lyase family enzyme
MFSHVMLGSNDIQRSKTFYDATFAAFGGPAGIIDPSGRLVYMHNGGIFILNKAADEVLRNPDGTAAGVRSGSGGHAQRGAVGRSGRSDGVYIVSDARALRRRCASARGPRPRSRARRASARVLPASARRAAAQR